MSDLALDIGGANLKAAHRDGGSWALGFELWRQPERLTQHLCHLADRAPDFTRVLVTMTGEMCDCFETKRQGVCHILESVSQVAGDRPVCVWTLERRFVDVAAARAQPLRCAASNWLALAAWVAKLWPAGITVLVDTGSTTTDVVLLKDGEPLPSALTDTQRLSTGELVYLGATRTPLCALGPWVTFEGQPIALMAEHFATMGDVQLVTGTLPSQPQCTDTADGRPMTPSAATARIGRMIGADAESMSVQNGLRLAEEFCSVFTQRIADAIRRVAGGRNPQRVVASGSGDFMAASAASLALPSVRQISLADRIGADASAAACAMALLHLCDV